MPFSFSCSVRLDFDFAGLGRRRDKVEFRTKQFFSPRRRKIAFCLTTFSAFVFLFGYAFKWFFVLFLLLELAAFFAAGCFIALRPLFASRILHLRTLLHRALAIIFTCVFCHNITSSPLRNRQKSRFCA